MPLKKDFQSFGSLLVSTFWEWWSDNCFRLAASLAFYTIFSLAPVSLIAVEIASLLFAEQRVEAHFIAQINEMIGVEGGEVVRRILANTAGTEFGAGIPAMVGLVMVLIGSTAVFAELQSALNHIWDVDVSSERGQVKGLLMARFRSLAIVLVVGFLLLVSLLISAGLAGAQEFMAERIPGVPFLWQALNIVASFAITTLLFAMIYIYLPDVKIGWDNVITGALVTAALFTIGKFIIGIYLGQTAIASTYGAAGSFVVFLIWIYYSSLIILFGAEFTHVYTRHQKSAIAPLSHAVRKRRKSSTGRATVKG